MYIKETNAQKPVYSFIAHYYNHAADEIEKIEIELADLVSPVLLSLAIEQFREVLNQKTIAVDKTKPLQKQRFEPKLTAYEKNLYKAILFQRGK